MSSETPNYKDTLNLPKTDFPMKGNLPQREPQLLKFWDENNIYKKLLASANKGTFSFPDGPAYANGNLHIGHALNKILKDIVIKYKNMQGLKAPWIPGWDCHGLPIEHGVAKKLGSKRAEMSDKEIRELCRQDANQWIEKQKEQARRYGIFGDWDNPYKTLDPAYEAEEIRVLAKILKTGAFYYGEKPVYWCWALQTALAEAEVEYKEHTSPTIYLKFYWDDESRKKINFPEKSAAVIWTTTPWTIPANLAITAHPDFDYGLYQLDGEHIVIAKGLEEQFTADTGKTLKLEKTFKGAELEGLKTIHPMYERPSPIILGEHVTLEAGTGLVHTAPGHGAEDYVVGLKYGLDILSPVDPAGKFTSEVPEYEGIHVFKANPMLIEQFEKSGHLIFHNEITHSYPHCWRSKTPLIYRATPQWFLKMDHGENSIRKKSLEAIKNVQWIPEWGENRITAMIENRPDWCLSRQRIWGVPIPVFYCESCSTPLADAEVMNRVADKMETHGGIEAYFDTPVEEFTSGKSCEKCGENKFKKGKDILDVWFDSGSCFAAVQEKREGLYSPADLYLEGSDQHRGWFHTSLLASIAAEDRAPFKKVLTHGFVMFAKGQKMSKSLGNVVDPQDIIKQNGADILRLWASHEDYAQDLSASPESFKRISETYRRLRNTVRFLLGNLNDFDPAKDQLPYSEMHELDQWALAKLYELVEKSTQAYENYEFYKIYHLINNFATVDLSAFYLNILKDRLYISKKDGPLRRSSQTVIYHMLKTLTTLMTPILSFLAEESYGYIPGDKKESVFLEDFPQLPQQWQNAVLLERFAQFAPLRDAALKILEDMRKNKTIGSSLEAKILFSAEKDQLQLLKSMAIDLPSYIIASQVEISEGPFKVEAVKADGEKCARCWNYHAETNKNDKFPGICPRCVEALS